LGGGGVQGYYPEPEPGKMGRGKNSQFINWNSIDSGPIKKKNEMKGERGGPLRSQTMKKKD